MSASAAVRLHAVAAGFAKLGVPALADRAGRWRLMLVNGRPLAADARLDDGWLAIGARVASPRGCRESWDLLRLTDGLPAAVKPVRDGAALAVRAELRADLDEATFRRRLGEAIDAVLAAARRLEDGRRASAPRRQAADEPAGWPELVAELAARRWTARERGAGRWSVELATEAGMPATAELAHFAAGATAISLAVTVPGERSAASRAALAEHLLASTAALRLVRAAADGDGSPRFEVRFASRPELGELDEALGALAAAARLALPAAEALGSETAGRWYLAARRPAAPAASRGRGTTRDRRAAHGGATNEESEVNCGEC
jgi:hypothetical protein